ncbi:MAG: response regulator [Clostridiales bacterium]|nr:response regulator [Clostridiales bacterium]
MLNILICDDDVLLVQHLRGLVHDALSSRPHRIDTFSTAASLRQAVRQGMQADLAILDIRLEGENNGIQLAKELFPEGSRTQVIFLTAYLEFCSAVYETDHIYFLLKPVEQYGSLTALMSQIPPHFLQCHKSFCVNMDCVREMRANFFLLDRGENIPISQSKKADTRARFLDYLNHYL